MQAKLKKAVTSLMAATMILTGPTTGVVSAFRYHDISSEKSSYINATPVETPAKFDKDPTSKEEANDQLKDPDYPATYTVENNFKVQRGDRRETNYQPYIATVGDENFMTQEEKDKINHIEPLPEMDGYSRPIQDIHITYDFVKNNAQQKGELKETTPKDAIFDHSLWTNLDFVYSSVEMPIKVKHVFQELYNNEKYGPLPGQNDPIVENQKGRIGHDLVITSLDKDERVGFEPEENQIVVRISENTRDFEVEYRYNRSKFVVNYDTSGGTDIPAQVLYYGHTIPKASEPQKIGAIFKGWQASHDIHYKEGAQKKVIKAGTLIPGKNSEFFEGMPAHDLTFTAVWEEELTADYTVLYYTEKADHDFGEEVPENLRDKYDYVGARVMTNQEVGTSPNLEEMLPEGVTFPDLEGKPANITSNKEELGKYFVYNKDLTDKENSINTDGGLVQKTIDATGNTIYKVFYNRTVYKLYFEKNNVKSRDSYNPVIIDHKNKKLFYPTGDHSSYTPNEEDGTIGYEMVNDIYSFSARFGQSLRGLWPTDAYIRGNPKDRTGNQGWILNTHLASGQVLIFYRDTPPYRLTANEFIDIEYTKKSTSKGYKDNYYGDKDLVFGIALSGKNNIRPIHVDFQLETFNDGEYKYTPSLYYWKWDTAFSGFRFAAPELKGFKTPERQAATRLEYMKFLRLMGINNVRKATPEQLKESVKNALDELNEGRPEDEKVPYQIPPVVFNNIIMITNNCNARLDFKYKRNSYKLNLNSNPTVEQEDSYFEGKTFADGSSMNQDVKYDYPIADLKLPLLTEADKPDVYNGKGMSYKFLGWATDPKGVNMIQKVVREEDGSEKLVKDKNATKMPNYNIALYGIWGEEEHVWTISFDPNGGTLGALKPEQLATHKKGEKIQTTIGEKEYILPEVTIAGDNEKAVQKVNINHRLTIKEPVWSPKRQGYDFLGWEVVRKKADGSVNTTYKDTYGVPELYAFQNEVVQDAYLKAIWVPNNLISIPVVHHFYDSTGKELLRKQTEYLTLKRVGSYVSAVATKQGTDYLVMKHDDERNELEGNADYEEILRKSGRKNAYFQTMKIANPYLANGEKNPDAFNEFHFYYRKFRTRKYKINYFDERIKDKELTEDNKKAYRIINKEGGPEIVENGNRHYDSRNYRKIPGWKLTSAPQQQLFFDLDAEGNFLGINGARGDGSDEISFYYKDIRVIERESSSSVIPDGYHRVVFKIDPNRKGGTFARKADGSVKTEVVYDVIDGLYSDHIPIPQELKEEDSEEEDKFYIKPDPGKAFVYWDESKLFNRRTVIDRNYKFTAFFDWSGLHIDPLVRTESLKDVNDFMPSMDDLKGALSWVKNGVKGPLPAGINVTINETEEEIYQKVKELGNSDSNEDFRTVKIAATVDYGSGSVQDIEIPIRIYKNIYEALTTGEKPKYLADAEKGDLKDVTGDYIKVIVNPTDKVSNKDTKVYYVNKHAKVEIPEIVIADAEKGKIGFISWTSDNDAVNTDGVYLFKDDQDKVKRYKFTKETVIQPMFAEDVVEQPGKDKPQVPKNYVKVIVNTTDKATDDTRFEKIFWVNPTKKVEIPGIVNPTGKSDQQVELEDGNGVSIGNQKVDYIFNEWKKVQVGEDDDHLQAVDPAETIDFKDHQFADKVTVIEAIYKKSIKAAKMIELQVTPLKIAESLKSKVGTDYINKFIPTEDDLRAFLQYKDENGTFTALPSDAEIVIKNDPYEALKENGKEDNEEFSRDILLKVEVTFASGAYKGQKTHINVPVKLYKNIYEALNINFDRPADMPDTLDVPELENGYVKVTIDPTDKVAGHHKKVFYVNPKAKVRIKNFDFTDEEKEASGFLYWTSDNQDQLNESGDQDGHFQFEDDAWTTAHGLPLRQNFAKDTVIYPVFADEVVEQPGKDKPQVPKNYVKVIVRPTTKAKVSDERIFWVKPNTEVMIPVDTPEAIEDWTYEQWTIGEPRENRRSIDLTRKNIFTQNETIITARYSYKPKEIQDSVLDYVDGLLKTIVEVNGKTASETSGLVLYGEEAAGSLTVTDNIEYVGLIPNESYTVIASLYDITAGDYVVKDEHFTGKVADETGAGEWNIQFADITLLSDHQYVVLVKGHSEHTHRFFEADGSVVDKEQVLIHAISDQAGKWTPVPEFEEAIKDKSETIIVKKAKVPTTGILKTTISVGEASEQVTGTAENAAVVKVPYKESSVTKRIVDTVTYENMPAGKKYVIISELMKFTEDAPAGEVVKTITLEGGDAIEINADGNGSFDVDFGEVSLEADAAYVIYETAISADLYLDDSDAEVNHIVEHKDRNDKAQTVLAERYSKEITVSKVEKGKTDELVGATVRIVADDKVLHEWVTTKEAKLLNLTDGEYTMVEVEAPDGYELAKDIKFRIKNGELEIMDASGNYNLAANGLLRMEDIAKKVEKQPNDDSNKPKLPTDPTKPNESTSSTTAQPSNKRKLPKTGTAHNLEQMLFLLVVGSLLATLGFNRREDKELF
ncbi:InlB B-repeat-containing protein [Allofustis seminis]|uniref:InlB B-repeat-containing protein n=1 Tax=Allofustis seminis TaxID=166939 RepID=UPI000373B925|nr:InlB B-repeat-containing protein [Allofustis seminis]